MTTGRWVDDANSALVTDFYELTMAAGYHQRDMVYPATFDLFVRSLPENRNFLVAAGLDDVLAYLENLRFTQESIDYLGSLDMFDPAWLNSLADFRFTGEVRAVAEGEVVFPDEPLLSVTAPLPEAQLIETFVLNAVGFQTMIASKAARITLAAGDRSFFDFSPRRDHAADAALKGARAAYIGGAAGTSMTLAGALYGVPVSGTMAHSFVMSFDDEIDAFIAFARTFPDNAVLLIDTYDTEEGARKAVAAAGQLEPDGITIRGVRLDSGDLVELSRRVREILDDGGLTDARIFASGDLDEYRIHEMVSKGCCVDAFGVGTRLGTSADAPYLQVVYKLVEDANGMKMKLSSKKRTLPGRKQVYRIDEESRDVITLDDERIGGGRALLGTVMRDGKRTGEPEALETMRDRRRDAVAALPERLRTLTGKEEPFPVSLSPRLTDAMDDLVDDLT
jgi:nicotinate phosphoribosyltransferase